MMGRKTTLMLANMMLGTVLGLVALKVTSLWYGATYVGQVAVSLGFLGIVFFITDMGMGQAHIKRVSEGRDPGDCFATFAVFKAVSTGVFVFIVLGVVWVYAVVLGKPLVSTTLPVLFLALAYYVAKSLQEIGQSSFDARLETARSQIAVFSDTIVRVGLTVLGGILILAVIHKDGPLHGRLDETHPFVVWARADPAAVLAIATAAGAIAAATVSFVMLRRVLERGRFRWDLLRDYATFAFPLFLTTAVGMIAAHVDSAALGFFRSDTETGQFYQVRRIPLVLGGIATAVSVLLFPTISALSARGDLVGVQRHMDRSIRYLSMLLSPLLTFVIVFAEPVIRIGLSDEFVPAADALRVLLVYILFTTLATPHATLVLGLGRSGVAARISGVTAVLIVVLDLIFIPDDIRVLGIPLLGLGVMGAAVSTLIAGVFFYGALRLASRRLAGYRERGHIFRHLAAAAVAALPLLALHTTVYPLVHWYDLLLYFVLSGLLYFGALLAMREFTREDWRFVTDSVHPIEMFRYIRSELRTRRR